ncbi:MAG: glutaredoxin family protein [Cellulomonadaceae bacterium]
MSEPSPRVEIFTRVGCHLCDDAVGLVAEVCEPRGVAWRERDVDAEGGQVLAELSDLVPVVRVDGVQQGFWRIDRARLERALG